MAEIVVRDYFFTLLICPVIAFNFIAARSTIEYRIALLMAYNFGCEL